LGDALGDATGDALTTSVPAALNVVWVGVLMWRWCNP
jgi:hypothetical protein